LVIVTLTYKPSLISAEGFFSRAQLSNLLKLNVLLERLLVRSQAEQGALQREQWRHGARHGGFVA
jgi:hypothetical protein